MENIPIWFDDYIILGDDVVIHNTNVAKRYQEIITKTLGVSISQSKSLVSKDTFEFAKRIVFQGVEVTGFPVAAVVETISSPIEL